MYQGGKKIYIMTMLLMVFAVGCKKKDPNPELRDPVYLDLKSLVGDLTRDVATFEASVLEEQGNVELAAPNTKDLVLARKKLSEAKVKLQKAEQNLKYYEIRLERRRIEGRIAYGKAFDNGEDWPDPNEFEAYQANKALRSAKSSWSSRVPKLKDRIDAYSSGQTAKKEPAAAH